MVFCTSFNYFFHILKKDNSNKCAAFFNLSEEGHMKVAEEQEHLERKEWVRAEKAANKEWSRTDPSFK